MNEDVEKTIETQEGESLAEDTGVPENFSADDVKKEAFSVADEDVVKTEKPKRRKYTAILSEALNNNETDALSKTLLNAIDAEIDPYAIVPTGYINFDLDKLPKRSSEWQIGKQIEELYYIFSLVARNFTYSEIVEDFALNMFDWDRIAEIGWEKRNEALSKVAETRQLYESERNKEKKLEHKLEYQKLKGLVPQASDYGQSMMAFLKRRIPQVINKNRRKWRAWLDEERRLWLSDKSYSIPTMEKTYRISLLNRLLDYEMGLNKKNSYKIVAIMKAIKEEVEGQVITVNWSVDDVASSIHDGRISKDDWVEVISVIQRILVSSVKGDAVEDIRCLLADKMGIDYLIDAEVVENDDVQDKR